jgi:hypothetical protein
MAPFPKKLNELCTPAAFYFIISIFGLVIIMFQNVGNRNRFNLGKFSCQVPNTLLLLAGNLVYILFWTWILNLICKDGHSIISWLLVLLPFIFAFIIFGLVILNKM